MGDRSSATSQYPNIYISQNTRPVLKVHENRRHFPWWHKEYCLSGTIFVYSALEISQVAFHIGQSPECQILFSFSLLFSFFSDFLLFPHFAVHFVVLLNASASVGLMGCSEESDICFFASFKSMSSVGVRISCFLHPF